ncbi:hypothetical protein Agabi119p4_6767 [Agaricus bisporus var. burnettii]|uniref:Integrase catalytic domain-containing protein n=1 Tax=Agaricus bisporus var. burnettii TaxID=192524 RepID=A0A8H7CCE7_AGABI|nr:hypothetical protein Agabi119p4_6767 [Agaricus bisporus var. burnettii]
MSAIQPRRSARLNDKREQREIEAAEMEEAAANKMTEGTPQPKVPAEFHRQSARRERPQQLTLAQSLTAPKPVTPFNMESDDITDRIVAGIATDPLLSVIKKSPEKYKAFSVDSKGLITKETHLGERVTCIPNDRKLITRVINRCHEILGHYGEQRTSEYIRRWYWWPALVKDCKAFCKSCQTCATSKTSTTKPSGELHSLPIPVRPWQSIGMDFVGPFPEAKGHNYLWVVLCRMTSMVHLIPVHTTMSATDLSWIYVRDIVRLHGLPESIVSDRDSKFTSKWWKELHHILGTDLLMSTSFHPQTDGQVERMNRNIGQIFRSSISHDQKNWVDKCPLIEFAINSSVAAATKFAPFELNYGFMPSMIRDSKIGDSAHKGVRAFADAALLNIAAAHDAIIEARVAQTWHANKRRQTDTRFEIGDLVFLSTKNLNLPKDRARKLCPKFIGPYKVLEARPATSNYKLELPAALLKRKIHPTFHVGLLRPYVASDDQAFPDRSTPKPYDFGIDDKHEWFVDEILGHRHDAGGLEFEVRWSLGDTTWEPYEICKDLAAMDRYLELQGAKNIEDLRQRVRATRKGRSSGDRIAQ